MVSKSRQFESNGIAISGPIRRWVWAAAPFGVAALTPLVSSSFQSFLPWAVLFGFTMGVAHWPARRRPGTVWVERGGIGIRRSGAPRHYPLCEPRQAWLTDAGEPQRVSMHLTRGRIIEIDVAPGQGAELLCAAGVDTEQQRVRFPLARADIWYPPKRWWFAASNTLLKFVASFIATVALVSLAFYLFTELTSLAMEHVYPAPMFGFALIWIIFFFGHTPPSVTLGADGLVLRAPFYSRFLAYHDIEQITERPDRIMVVLRNGSILTLRTWSERRQDDPHGRTFLKNAETASGYRGRLYEVLRKAHDRHQDSESGLIPARAGRDQEQWTRAVREAVRGGYRHAGMTRQQLIEVVRDGTAPLERRVGAVLGLKQLNESSDFDDELLRTVDSCANPRARVVLQATLHDSLDLEALEATAKQEEAEGAAAVLTLR